MRTLRTVLRASFAFACILGATGACTPDRQQRTEPGASTSDFTTGEVPRYATGEATRVVAQVQYAAANSLHQVGVFDPAKVSPSAIASALRKEDVDSGCSGERAYSKSKEDALRLYDAFVARQNPYADAASHSQFSTPESDNQEVRRLLSGQTATAVFAASYDYDNGKNPEQCLRYTFVALLADGTAARFEFDYQD